MFSKGYGVEFVVLVFLYTIVTVIKRANKAADSEIRRIP